MVKKWTKQELDFVIGNREKMNYIEMSKLINRTQLAIGWKLRELGFHRPDRWSEEETKFLKENSDMKPKDIVKYLNRTILSISTKRYEQKLTKPNLKEITNVELTPSFAYFIGCLCGDASIMSNKIRLGVKDKDFADEFYKHCKVMLSKSNINITQYNTNDGDYYVQISSLGLREYLIKNYGTFGTYNWKIPHWILNSDNEKIVSHFIRGLFDSEGSTQGDCIVCQTISPEMYKVSVLLKKLGIDNKTSIANRLTTFKNKVYIVTISSAKNINIFKKKVGFSIQRKQIRLINYLIKHSKSTFKKRLLNRNKHRIARLYNDGFSFQEIANKFNISSPSAIRKYVIMVLKQHYTPHN